MKSTGKKVNVLSFNSIRIVGFQSIQDLTYRLKNPGINILRGSNGIGKTTIFSALVWALFGYTLKKKKDVATWEDKQPSDYKGTKVEVDFKIGKNIYTVIRCSKYKGKIEGASGASRIMLFKDGEYLEQFRDKADVQAEIVRLIGYSFQLFTTSILFGQKLTRLIGESGPRKKELFEEAFEVSWLAEAKKKASSELKINKDELKDYQAKYDLLKTEGEAKEDKVDTLTHLSKTFKKDKADRVDQLEFKIHKHNKAIKERELKPYDVGKVTIREALIEKLRKRIEGIDELSQDVGRIHTEKEGLERELTVLNMSISNDINNLEKVPTECDSCHQPLDKKSVKVVKDQLEAKIAKQKSDKGVLENKIEVLQKDYDKVYKKYSSIDAVRKQIHTAEQEIQQLRKVKSYNDEKEIQNAASRESIAETEKELKEERDKKNPVNRKKLDKLQSQAIEIEQKSAKVKKYVNKLEKKVEAYNWVVTDPLSNKGIKAYLFAGMMEAINNELEKYASTLTFNVNFTIDLDSARKDFETTIYQGSHIRDYDELSGGQQQLVDVAVAFAMHGVMSSGKPTNILLMDEIFESLDASNIEKVIDLIKVKAEGLSVHLITHLLNFQVTNANSLLLEGKDCPKLLQL